MFSRPSDPRTLVRWHRAGFRCYRRWKSRPRGGRHQIDTDLRALIRRMMHREPASLIGRSRSSAFRLSTTTTVSMSLTGPRFSSESALGPLLLVKKFKQAGASLFLHQFFCLICFFVPYRRINLAASSATARLLRFGWRSEGSPLPGAIISRHNLVSGRSKDLNHDASCASGAKLRSGGPILPIGVKAKGLVGVPPPRTVIGAPSQA
jgi:hypothetical protein